MTCRCRSGECDPECDGPKLRAELERLTAQTGLDARVIREQLAEVERLRAAHEEILALWRKGETAQIGSIASVALEPKP